MTCTDVVEVILQDIVTADLTFLVDHRVGIFLTVLADILTTIGKIGVKHTFELDSHHIAPFGAFGKVEQVALRHTLHF